MSNMGYAQGDQIAVFNPSYPPKLGVVKKITPTGQIVVEVKGAVTCTQRFTNRGYEVGESRSWSRNYWYIESKPKMVARYNELAHSWKAKAFFDVVARDLEAVIKRSRADRSAETRVAVIGEVEAVLTDLVRRHHDLLAKNPDDV